MLKTGLFFICFNRGVLIAAYKKNVPLCSWLHSTERCGCQVCMASLFLKLIWAFRWRFAQIRKHFINGWNAESIFLHVPRKKKIWGKKKLFLCITKILVGHANRHSLQPRLGVETPSMCTFAPWLQENVEQIRFLLSAHMWPRSDLLKTVLTAQFPFPSRRARPWFRYAPDILQRDSYQKLQVALIQLLRHWSGTNVTIVPPRRRRRSSELMWVAGEERLAEAVEQTGSRRYGWTSFWVAWKLQMKCPPPTIHTPYSVNTVHAYTETSPRDLFLHTRVTSGLHSEQIEVAFNVYYDRPYRHCRCMSKGK